MYAKGFSLLCSLGFLVLDKNALNYLTVGKNKLRLV